MSNDTKNCVCTEMRKCYFHRDPMKVIKDGELGEYLIGPFYRCPCGQIWKNSYPVWVKSSKQKQEEWLDNYNAGKT